MDKFFNHDVAEWITKSVSRMDDDEAEMFTLFTVYEVHKQDIENNRRTLDRHIAEVQKSILDDLHPEIREMVTKAWDPDTPFEELRGIPQPRDKRGRWSKFSINIERGKNTQPLRAVNYREDKITSGKFDLSQALATAEDAGNAFSERWTHRGPDDHSTNERTYRRIRAGAQLLGHVPNKNVQAAAALGEFAGKMGPEAEKIIGPAARRTAYRYRGTERMPDDALYRVRDEAMITERKRLYSDEDFKTGRAAPLTPEQRMAASEAAAANYLYTRLPKKSLATLQRESGKLPPSEGVIINHEGEIVTQAVGYNEDHYLPFNLKNLKGLKGGAYVRTRSTGGLTSEDIYTGLVAGARSITVVSRSGVFTLDFEDDLRGGRRYSDKARQMVGRYAQTLDAVQSEKVSRKGLSPDERAEVREEVEAEFGDMGYTTAQIEQKIRDREKEYSRTPQLTQSELDEINHKALEAVQSGKAPRGEGTERFVPKDPKKAFNYYRSEFMDAALEDKQSRMYKLDADGYEAAMEALQEQFPYYVARVKVHKIPRGTEKDTGYVRPNYIRPKAVQAGYFDDEINGKGKFPASELHYQNYSRGGAGSAASGEEAAEGAVDGAAKPPRNLNEARANNMTKKQREAAVVDAVTKASELAANVEGGDRMYPMLTKYRKEFNYSSVSATDVEKVMDEVHALSGMLASEAGRASYPGAAEELQKHVERYREKDKQLKSREPFNEKDWTPGRVRDYPQMFEDKPWHHPGGEPELYEKHLNQIFQRKELASIINPQMDDKQLMAAEKVAGEVYAAASELRANPESGNALNRLEDALIDAGKTNEQIGGLLAEVDARNFERLDILAEEQKRKALGVMEARSVLAASAQAREAAPKLDVPAGQAVVPSSVVTAEEKAETKPAETKPAKAQDRPLPDVINDMVDDRMWTPGVRTKMSDLAIALRSGDDQSVEDALEELPHHLQRDWTPLVHQWMQKRDGV